MFKQHYTVNSDGITCTFLSSLDLVLNNVISGYRVASSSVECEYLRNFGLQLGTLVLVNESHDRQTDRQRSIYFVVRRRLDGDISGEGGGNLKFEVGGSRSYINYEGVFGLEEESAL